jgi:transcriptional regulator with XRE-family HTH domain
MSQSLIVGIERGKQEPSRNLLVAIAQKYHVSLDGLLLGMESAIVQDNEENEKLKAEDESLKKKTLNWKKISGIVEEECKIGYGE